MYDDLEDGTPELYEDLDVVDDVDELDLSDDDVLVFGFDEDDELPF